jgi:hypothetical protein
MKDKYQYERSVLGHVRASFTTSFRDRGPVQFFGRSLTADRPALYA